MGLPRTPKQMVVVVRVGISYGDFFSPSKTLRHCFLCNSCPWLLGVYQNKMLMSESTA